MNNFDASSQTAQHAPTHPAPTPAPDFDASNLNGNGHTSTAGLNGSAGGAANGSPPNNGHRFLTILPDDARADIAAKFRESAARAATPDELVKLVYDQLVTLYRIDPQRGGAQVITLFESYSDLARHFAKTVIDEAEAPDGSSEPEPIEWPDNLLPHHRKYLEDRGITPEIARLGFKSATKKTELANVGFSASQQRVLNDGRAALLIPLLIIFVMSVFLVLLCTGWPATW